VFYQRVSANAGHGFEGADPADLERAYAAMMQWFERHLGSAAK
jgi:dipeptidyl aminopeptidase/acylaminoacyl peptidase